MSEIMKRLKDRRVGAVTTPAQPITESVPEAETPPVTTPPAEAPKETAPPEEEIISEDKETLDEMIENLTEEEMELFVLSEIGRAVVDEYGLFECDTCSAIISPVGINELNEDEFDGTCPECEDGTLSPIHERVVVKKYLSKHVSLRKVNGKFKRVVKKAGTYRRKVTSKMLRGLAKARRHVTSQSRVRAEKTKNVASAKGLYRQNKPHSIKVTGARKVNAGVLTRAGGRYYIVGEEVIDLGPTMEEALNTMGEMYEGSPEEFTALLQQADHEMVRLEADVEDED